MDSRPSFYEFFAGGGMARIGLGPGWRCSFANDVDALKARAYRANFAHEDLRVGDVWDLSADDLPDRADLAWASSPCQDISLAGGRQGLSGACSSVFWGFWAMIETLDDEGRAPETLVIENVTGLFSSNDGDDFALLCRSLAERGYRFGALEIDASAFLPHSRPRLFMVATRRRGPERSAPALPFHTARVVHAFERLPPALARSWAWWDVPPPPERRLELQDMLEPDDAVAWRSPEQTQRLLADLSSSHRLRLQLLQAMRGRRVATLYRRIRTEAGVRVQRAELRADGIAGCLRTPRGGSSRQFLAVVEGASVRTRLLTPREGARLMGLPEGYVLPHGATAAFQVVGDGVAAPVVRHLTAHLLEPLLSRPATIAAA